MKISIALLALLSGVAQADTFSPATDGSYHCISYCSGYVTDSANTVEYVNLTNLQKLTISIDGKAYSGTNIPGQSVTLLASDGTYALVSVQYWTKRTCTHSGRGQHCTTWTFVTSGTFAI